MNTLRGKISLVTGGGQGIGRTIACLLADEGASVAVADVHTDSVKETVAEITNHGGSAFALTVNVADGESVKQAVKQLLDTWERVDILVNNAGITKDGLLIRLSDEDWTQVLSVNLTGAFLCTRAVLPSMVKQRYGRVVSIASIVAMTGNAGQANYAASKGGLISLMKVIAREYANRGITANAVAPGFIDTAMTRALPDSARESLIKQIPCQRLGTTADVAHAVRFLVSPEASYITGQVIHVNGGMLM